MQLPVQVQEAGFVFTAKYKNTEPNVALAQLLVVDDVDFGECLEWHDGAGMGQPPAGCATTFTYAAFPNMWALVTKLMQGVTIAAANIPASGDEIVVHTFAMPVDPNLVQGWLSGQTTHEGVLLSSGASEPTEFYLLAQGSESPPELQARLCLP
jgi:hypothetical protein